MKKIALLGLGAMGQRMAVRLIQKGYQLTLWNRSGIPTTLHNLPAKHASTPCEAASDAEMVMAMVRDDLASKEVWLHPDTGALVGLKASAIAVESSTLSPSWLTSLHHRVLEKGGRFLDAPVVGSRPQAETGTLVFLVGGREEDIQEAHPLLSVLGSAIHAMGQTPAGSIAKLAVNALFGAQVALMGELLAMVRESALSPDRFLETLGTLPVLSTAAKGAGAAMLAKRFDPMFPIELVAKDFAYAQKLANSFNKKLPISERALEVFQQAMTNNLGSLNITAIAKLYE
jgi:3-hydroxyisobutyrate dehydrogenase